MRLLVCGGAGFIGSTFVRLRVGRHGDAVTVIDKLTYAGRRENLQRVSEAIRFVHGAIEDPAAVAEAADGCDAIINFAAETHVDRSISRPQEFVTTNVQGTWLYVEDFCEGIGAVLLRGSPGAVYNCGGPDECENLELVRRIVALMGADESLIEFVSDRPGHDRRYSLSCERLRALGWEPRVTLAEGLERTVRSYREHTSWWEPVRSGAYRASYCGGYGRALGA